MRQIFASRLVAMALSCALLGGLACSSGGSGGGTGGSNGSGGSGSGGSGSGGSGSGGSGTGGMGTGGSGSGGSGTGGTVSDAGSGGADAATDAPRDGGDAAGDGSTGALTFKSTTLVMMGNNLAFPASASAPMNQSPELEWTNPPAGTLSFAVSIFDLGMQNTHFVLSNISPDTRMLPANLPRGAMPTMPAGATWKSAFNNPAGPGYEGPGAGPSMYEIELWALNVAKLPANIASQSLNTMHATGLASVKISSIKIIARGQRNGF